MTADQWVKSVMLMTITIVFVKILFFPPIYNIEDYPELVGCYYYPVKDTVGHVEVGRDGSFRSMMVSTTVQISKDKNGLSFLPAQHVTLSGGGTPIEGSGSPAMLRIAQDKKSFTIERRNSALQLIKNSCRIS